MAERLIGAVSQRIGGDDRNEWLHTPGRRAELTAQAQVHATLALAAATATGMQDRRAADAGPLCAVAPGEDPDLADQMRHQADAARVAASGKAGG